MSEFVKRYRFWLRNGFDVVEAAMQAKNIVDEEFYKNMRRIKNANKKPSSRELISN